MKQLYVTTRSKWRRWLAKNHDKEADGIWLVFYKKKAGRPSLEYEESVEEALCFGWIDSLIKRIDDERYCRKFTPRKNASLWSCKNKERVGKIIKEKRMTGFGLAKIEAAKRSGIWQKDPRPVITREIPQELSNALAQNQKAKSFFEMLAPTYQKHFIGWIVTAKRPEKIETRETDVWLLTVKSSNALGLGPNSNPDGQSHISRGDIALVNSTPANLAYLLENMVRNLPIIDRTGLANNPDFDKEPVIGNKPKVTLRQTPKQGFDINLKWDDGTEGQPHNIDNLKQALLDQLGLELVPTNMPIEMLVVENAK